jgi:phosphoheptose isomerase
MALAAADALGLDLASSWVVGDRPEDLGLARAVGASAIVIGQTDEPGVVAMPDLATAVASILDGSGRTIPPRPRFPAHRYDSAGAFAQDYSALLGQALGSVDVSEVDRAAKILNSAYDRDAAVFACGNGGSASIANHLQCDHVKGVRMGTDLRTRVSSLSSNVEILSAVANDIGYDAVFEFQLESLARPCDVLVVVSSSGRSPNIVRALEWAASHDMQSIALTGFEGEPARSLATVSLHVHANNYGIVEDAHQACMHLLAQYVRQSRLPSDAVAAQVF